MMKKVLTCVFLTAAAFGFRALTTTNDAGAESVNVAGMFAGSSSAGTEPCVIGVDCVSDEQASTSPCDKSTGQNCHETDEASTSPCDRATGVGCHETDEASTSPCDRTTGQGCHETDEASTSPCDKATGVGC